MQPVIMWKQSLKERQKIIHGGFPLAEEIIRNIKEVWKKGKPLLFQTLSKELDPLSFALRSFSYHGQRLQGLSSWLSLYFLFPTKNLRKCASP